jgi:hypothetical protein
MSSDEQVHAALRRPQRPAPDEAGAYERFLRRRTSHRHRVRVSVAISAVLLVACGVVAVRLLPVGSTVPPVAPPSTISPPVTLSLGQLDREQPGLLDPAALPGGGRFRPVGPAVLIRGVREGFRWRFIVVLGVDQHGQRRGMCHFGEDRPNSGMGGGACGWSRNPTELLLPGSGGTGLPGIAEYHGAAPKATARVRLQLWSRRAPVVVDAIDPGPAFPFRVYLGFAPPDRVRRVVALDAAGRELGRTLDLPPMVDDTPTDAPVLVATQTSATGTRKLYAYHAHQASCLRVVDVDGHQAVHACQPPGAAKDAIDQSAIGTPRTIIAYGGLPRAARTVRFTAANGPPIQVQAFDGGDRLGRAYYLAAIPCGRRGGRLTVLDARGNVLGTSTADLRC